MADEKPPTTPPGVSTPPQPVPIVISNAKISGEGGEISNATITGDAVIKQSPPVPIDPDAHPEHPILLPPPTTGDNQFWLLVFVPNPPPPHWEWIAFTPGSPPERPHPQPPEPPSFTPPGTKPFPPEGGWGYQAPWGWIYWPGPKGAGPKRQR